ncbi:MAG: cupin domain-containing protein [Candidatus Omnitrophica bacterium]|nr:cupin domain-containing protein [Candidatus Omnitrophota bacterium]MCK5179691.1 cupin domain-containing protein [Candidatus Omnitrophota bacterium]MCK5259903.1 cupin domain-containing protein [Candidatus Omnitrophota bacterium]
MPNIYDQIPEELREEVFEEITRGDSFRLERIVSKGHSTPEGKWYDQDEDEWVILLKGNAGILIEGEAEAVTLNPGDHYQIPAHSKHRVEWTDSKTETVWVALHYKSDIDKQKG